MTTSAVPERQARPYDTSPPKEYASQHEDHRHRPSVDHRDRYQSCPGNLEDPHHLRYPHQRGRLFSRTDTPCLAGCPLVGRGRRHYGADGGSSSIRGRSGYHHGNGGRYARDGAGFEQPRSVEEAIEGDRLLGREHFERLRVSDASLAYEQYVQQHQRAYIERLFTRHVTDGWIDELSGAGGGAGEKATGSVPTGHVCLDYDGSFGWELVADEETRWEGIKRTISPNNNGTGKFAWPEPIRDAVVEVDGEMTALPTSSLSLSDLQRAQCTSGCIALGRLQAGWTRRAWLVSASGPRPDTSEAVGTGFAGGAGNEATPSEGGPREAENSDRVFENDPQEKKRGRSAVIRCAPSLTGTPEHVEHHLQVAQELLQALRDEDVRDVGDVGEGATKEQLDRLLTRLRVVHRVCFYCATAYACTEELLAECGPVHLRDALLSSPTSPESKEPCPATDGHQRQQEEQLDRKLRRLVDSLRVHLPPVSTDDWLVRHHARVIDESKVGCRHCTKLFRGADFVLKHLRLKHGDAVSSAERELAALNVLLAAPRSLLPPPMLPFVPSKRRAHPMQPSFLGHKRPYQQHQGDDTSMRRPLKRYIDLDAPQGIADADISYD